MANRKQKEGYIRAVARLIRETNRLEGEALGRAFGLLDGARGRIEESLMMGGREWDVARLKRLKREVVGVMGDFGRRYGDEFRGFQERAWGLGARTVEEPLAELGIEVGYWPMLTRTQLEILQGFSADLITNMSADAIRRISGVVVGAAMTELSPFVAMEEITQLLGLVGAKWTGPWRATGVLYRAELITRTELLRTFSLGTEARVQQAAEVVPEMGKRWVATGDARTRPSHLAAHGQVVPAKDGKFNVGGYECDYPRDPGLPPEESCNCRCRHLAWMPEFAEDWEELDERVRQLLEEGAAGPDVAGKPSLDDWMIEGLFDPSGMAARLGRKASTDWRNARGGEQFAAKERIVAELSRRSGMSSEDVNLFIKQWSITSNDDDMRSLAIQKAASELFDIPLSEFTADKMRAVEAYGKEQIAELMELGIVRNQAQAREYAPQFFPLFSDDKQKGILRAMYEHTQEQLGAAGLKQGDVVALRRGVRLPREMTQEWTVGDSVSVRGNVLESWSLGEDIARDFAAGRGGVVFEIDIPVEHIMGSARTGFGCLTEGELVVFGMPGEARILMMP